MKNHCTKFTVRDATAVALFAMLAAAPALFAAAPVPTYPENTSPSPNNSPAPAGSIENERSSSSLKWSDRHFVNKAAESNQKEMAFAQLASQQASNAGVRSFAQKVLSDHGTMDQDLMQLAQQKGVKLDHMSSMSPGYSSSSNATPATSGSAASSMRDGTYDRTSAPDNSGASVSNPALGWSGNHEYSRMSHLSGQDFDRDFINKMVDAHESAIKLFEKKAGDADDQEVRAFAEKYLPSLREHLQRAQELQKSIQ